MNPSTERSWKFPDIAELGDSEDLIAIGADLNPRTLVEAYRNGFFPMPVLEDIGWFCPEERGVLFLDDFRISTSLKKSLRKFSGTINHSFSQVVDACADPARDHGWIDDDIKSAYGGLHKLGWAHSIEVWDGKTLVGGLYGVAIDKFFAGESMFHHKTDASKAALAYLVHSLRTIGAHFIDVQWATPHLESLGCTTVTRDRYKNLLEDAILAKRPMQLSTSLLN